MTDGNVPFAAGLPERQHSSSRWPGSSMRSMRPPRQRATLGSRAAQVHPRTARSGSSLNSLLLGSPTQGLARMRSL